SPPSTAWRWAAVSKSLWRAISSSHRKTRRSRCRSRASALPRWPADCKAGRPVSAREGFELGFVNEVVPAGEALRAAERWADQICRNSPMSIRASKQAVLEGLNVPLPEAMVAQREYPAVREMLASADYVEGPKAFAEKRP